MFFPRCSTLFFPVELNDIHLSPLLQYVKVPLKDSITIWCINCSFILYVCRLAEGACSSIIQVINKAVKEYWPQYKGLRCPTNSECSPAGLYASDHNILMAVVQLLFCLPCSIFLVHTPFSLWQCYKRKSWKPCWELHKCICLPFIKQHSHFKCRLSAWSIVIFTFTNPCWLLVRRLIFSFKFRSVFQNYLFLHLPSIWGEIDQPTTFLFFLNGRVAVVLTILFDHCAQSEFTVCKYQPLSSWAPQLPVSGS